MSRIGLLGLLCVWGCSAGAASSGTSGSTGSAGPTDAGSERFADSARIEVAVPPSGRVYVKLSPAAVVTPTDPASSTEWDLAFEGLNVYTNSGPSGSAKGGAFGALDLDDFLSSDVPTVPFVSPDAPGGAFIDWYAYEGRFHVLYSRFHVYGVKRGARLWKVQLLSYYSEVDHTATSALFQLRYADITGGGATQSVMIDGSAGGLAAPTGAATGCLTLATGAVAQLTQAQAAAQTDWDLCFRRDVISVNGEAGGPGGVGAVDLQAALTEGEVLAQVEARTAESEQALFDGATAASFASAPFRGDHVVSAFETGKWLDPAQALPAPVSASWLVVDASGQHKFLVAFSTFQNATVSSPGTIVMYIKPVNG